MAKTEVKEESKARKIVNIVVMTLEILVIIACIALSITVIVGSKTEAEALGPGYNITAVLSDSMDGTLSDEYEIGSFDAGDLLIIKKLSDEEVLNLQVGDVATYLGIVDGNMQLITHRIIKIEYVEQYDLTYYYTLGDKQRTGDEARDIAAAIRYPAGNMQGKVLKVIPKVGKAIHWFQDPNNFLWAVVIPLAALLAYNIFLFVRMLIAYKIKKTREEGELAVEAIKAQNVINEEEIKRKAIEEFLAQQKAQIAASDAPIDANKNEEVPQDTKLEDK